MRQRDRDKGDIVVFERLPSTTSFIPLNIEVKNKFKVELVEILSIEYEYFPLSAVSTCVNQTAITALTSLLWGD